MAKKRLKIKDKQGNAVDYDVASSSVTLDGEGGKSLDTKLQELEDEDGKAVKKVTFNGDTKSPNAQGNVEINQMQANWEETNPNYPSFIKNKPTIPTGVVVDQQLGNSTNPIANKAVYDAVNLVQTALNKLQTALNTITQDGAADSVINTFNEIKAFLNGISTSDPTLANTLVGLQQSITALQNAIEGKQGTLTFDNAPTSGSNNPVKSGGIYTALAEKADADDVYTKTEVESAIDDAFSEAQVAVVEEGTFGIIDGLGSDSTTDALSAAQGKVIKAAILTLWAYLGEYAFPGGKPTLNLGSGSVEFSVTYPTDEKITATPESGTAPESVELLDPLEITLGIASGYNLYVLDDDSVHVYMGGAEVVGAYNPTTQKVTIANVVGNVVIVANAITYVGYGEQNSPLVSMFDGLNRGGTTGQWKDTQEPNRVLTLDNCTENTDNVQFNGSDSTAFCTNSSYNKIAVKPENGTIEAVIGGMAVNSSTTFANPICNGYGQDERLIDLVIMYSTAGNINRIVCGFCQMKSTESSSSPSYTLPLAWDTTKSTITAAHLSVSDARAYIDGVAMSRSAYFSGSKSHTNSKFGVISYYNSSGTLKYSAGKMYCARIYSRQLSPNEVAQNYKVDQKRFNLT